MYNKCNIETEKSQTFDWLGYVTPFCVVVVELSEVLWNMEFHRALAMEGSLGVVATFAMFAAWAGEFLCFLKKVVTLLRVSIFFFRISLWIKMKQKKKKKKKK